MIDVNFSLDKRNVLTLDKEMRAALGSAISGISTGPYGVMVHFFEEPSADQRTAAQGVITKHKSAAVHKMGALTLPPPLTSEQVEIDLATNRLAELDNELDGMDSEQLKAVVRALAHLVAEHHQRIKALEGAK